LSPFHFAQLKEVLVLWAHRKPVSAVR